jgi:Rod binding domain-containing protein
MLGKEGTDRREKMEQVFDSLLGPENEQGNREVELGQLPDRQKHDLLRLQEKSEDLEALFVKMMLKDLQKANPIGGQGQMAGLARDFMNDAIAKATTKQGEGLGIAKTVFLDIAGNNIQNFVGQHLADATKQENDN